MPGGGGGTGTNGDGDALKAKESDGGRGNHIWARTGAPVYQVQSGHVWSEELGLLRREI
jgi:hypothetical protein